MYTADSPLARQASVSRKICNESGVWLDLVIIPNRDKFSIAGPDFKKAKLEAIEEAKFETIVEGISCPCWP